MEENKAYANFASFSMQLCCCYESYSLLGVIGDRAALCQIIIELMDRHDSVSELLVRVDNRKSRKKWEAHIMRYFLLERINDTFNYIYNVCLQTS